MAWEQKLGLIYSGVSYAIYGVSETENGKITLLTKDDIIELKD